MATMLADVAGEPEVASVHLAEVIQYRLLDRGAA